MSKPTRISIVLLFILVCTTSALTFKQSYTHLPAPYSPQHNDQPQAFMNHISYFQYNKQGLLQSHLTASSVTHYPDNDFSQFTNPHYLLYPSQGSPWIITADYAQGKNNMKQIDLWKHVKI